MHEQIASQIKELIMSSGVEVGQRLPSERALAQQLKVSRVVVREALKSLEQSGFVVRRTGAAGGAFIADNHHLPFFNSAYDLFRGGKLTLAHFYEARQTVECRSARLAAGRAKPEDIRRLRELNKRLIERPIEQRRLNEAAVAFHVTIAEISANPLIRLMVHSLMELLVALFSGLVKPGNAVGTTLRSGHMEITKVSRFIRRTYKIHEDIIDAIEAGDRSRAEESMAADTALPRKTRITTKPKN
ncbi:MAG TPA: FCD domain-containing protein [Syntrophorhabdaceae bacterium]|nr:FCD domain-containing protein [Syntrophorhabdaceae bacterium]